MSEKDKFILRLARKLDDLEKFSKLNAEYLSSASAVEKLTGLHKLAIKKLETNDNILDHCVDRSSIYSAICRFYHSKRKNNLPTTYELFDAVMMTDKLTSMDISAFQKLLLKMNFIWKKVGGHTVVIEKPLVRFERLNYLSKILQYREAGDQIFFIDELAFNQGLVMDVDKSRDFEKATGLWQMRMIHAIGEKNIVCQKEVKEFGADVLEDWIITDLFTYLTGPSVIVIQDLAHHKTKLIPTPTLYSSRLEMMKWLDHFDVPYTTEMSKYELFSLAEECTNLNTDLYKLDEIFKSRGHTLLRQPRSLADSLNPAVLLFKLLKNIWIKNETHKEKIMAANPAAVKQRYETFMMFSEECNVPPYTSSVMNAEKSKMHRELELDQVMDALMVMERVALKVRAKEGCVDEEEEEDVVSCCDSD